jgi:hypothetical protein
MLQQEALQRLVPTYEGRPYPLQETLLHPLKVVVLGLPFSVLALWTLRPGFSRLWDERRKQLLVALHCWTWPNLLLWSLPTEHKARFSFPLLPALSGLAAMVVFAWLTGKMSFSGLCFGHVSSGDPGQSRKVNRLAIVSLVGTAILWLTLKVGYANGLIHRRGHDHSPQANGQLLASLLPADQLLYLLDIKEDDVLFYFGRPALQLHNPAHLPAGPDPVYCLLDHKALQGWHSGKTVEMVQEITIAQGTKLYLVRVSTP